MTEIPERPPRPWWRYAMMAIGPVVLVVLFSMAGVEEILGALTRAHPGYVAAALGLAVPALLIRSVRWKVLLARDGARMTYGEVTAIFAYAVFVGTATPGRLGELFKVVHLRERSIPMGRGLASVLMDRLLDVAMLLVLAAGSLALVAGSRDVVVGVAAVVGFFMVLLLARSLVCGTLGEIVGRVLRPVLPGDWGRRIMEVRAGLCEALDELPVRAVAGGAALTVAGWAVNYLANYFLAQALGLPLSYVDVAGISAVASLVALVPISVMGAGTRDVALVAILAGYGVEGPEAIALSTMFLVFMIWNALMCGVSAFSRHVRGGPDAPGDDSERGA